MGDCIGRSPPGEGRVSRKRGRGGRDIGRSAGRDARLSYQGRTHPTGGKRGWTHDEIDKAIFDKLQSLGGHKKKTKQKGESG